MLVGLLGASSLSAQGTAMPRRDSIERVVRDRVAAGGSTGLAVAVIEPAGDGYTILASAGPAIHATTIFEIGSITKAFTGILLADMAARGDVRLDQPVVELLPPGTSIPARNGKQITLEQLATHTSGLPRLPSNLRPADPSNPYADYTPALLYQFLAAYRLPRDPGATYEYSNLGAGLLGHALAARAGTSFEELVRERILHPLGMTSTGITLTPPMRDHLTAGHDADGNVVPLWDLAALAGAGALRSSLDDMTRFLAAVRTPSDDATGRAIALATSPRFRVNSALSLGLGWHITTNRGDTLVWHNGGTGGFRTMIGVNTTTRGAMVLLGNSAQDNDDIVRHALIGLPLASGATRTEIALPEETLAAYVGTYELTQQFSLVVTLENGVLFVQPTGQPKFRIYAEAPDKFFFKVVEAQLEFTRDQSGAVTNVTLVQNGRHVGRKVR